MGNTGNAIVLAFFFLLSLGLLIGFGIIELPELEPKTAQPEEVKGEPFDWTGVYIGLIAFPIIVFLLSGIRIVRQTHRAVVETFGKYSRFMDSGITWVIPIVQRLYSLNVTETLVDVSRQDIITEDNLNANVDAQVYYRIGSKEEELKNAFYNVDNVKHQIVQLAVTTLRDVIGRKKFKEVNSNRKELNELIFKTLTEETGSWGIQIVRVELKEITPPNNVQETMNAIIMAENKRDANKDLALAMKIEAEGEKNARIQRALGVKQEKVLFAQGEAEAIIRVAEAEAEQIKLVNTSAQTYFRKEAITLKHLQVTQNSLENNTKYVVTEKGISPTLVLNESDRKIIPVPQSHDRTPEQEEQLRKDMSSDLLEKVKKKRKKGSDYQINSDAITKLFD